MHINALFDALKQENYLLVHILTGVTNANAEEILYMENVPKDQIEAIIGLYDQVGNVIARGVENNKPVEQIIKEVKGIKNSSYNLENMSEKNIEKYATTYEETIASYKQDQNTLEQEISYKSESNYKDLTQEKKQRYDMIVNEKIKQLEKIKKNYRDHFIKDISYREAYSFCKNQYNNTNARKVPINVGSDYFLDLIINENEDLQNNVLIPESYKKLLVAEGTSGSGIIDQIKEIRDKNPIDVLVEKDEKIFLIEAIKKLDYDHPLLLILLDKVRFSEKTKNNEYINREAVRLIMDLLESNKEDIGNKKIKEIICYILPTLFSGESIASNPKSASTFQVLDHLNNRSYNYGTGSFFNPLSWIYWFNSDTTKEIHNKNKQLQKEIITSIIKLDHNNIIRLMKVINDNQEYGKGSFAYWFLQKAIIQKNKIEHILLQAEIDSYITENQPVSLDGIKRTIKALSFKEELKLIDGKGAEFWREDSAQKDDEIKQKNKVIKSFVEIVKEKEMLNEQFNSNQINEKEYMEKSQILDLELTKLALMQNSNTVKENQKSNVEKQHRDSIHRNNSISNSK